jgi:hypothetical protein
VSNVQFGVLVALHLFAIGLKVAIFVVIWRYLREGAEVLEMGKSYLEMGRAQHTDARARAESTPVLLDAVEKVPDRTAGKVAEIIQGGDSGVLRKPPPLRSDPD